MHGCDRALDGRVRQQLPRTEVGLRAVGEQQAHGALMACPSRDVQRRLPREAGAVHVNRALQQVRQQVSIATGRRPVQHCAACVRAPLIYCVP